MGEDDSDPDLGEDDSNPDPYIKKKLFPGPTYNNPPLKFGQ